jgi:hypothetical protein
MRILLKSSAAILSSLSTIRKDRMAGAIRSTAI